MRIPTYFPSSKMASKVIPAIARLGGSVVSTGTNAVKYAKPRLQTFWTYAKVELKPPTFSEMPQVQESINSLIVAARQKKWKQLTVKEAWLNTLVGAEIMFCFFIGEVLGRRSLVGYYIPGAVHYEAVI
ncbi:ATP synthase subunit g, mitochondrial-like [Pomacea canaliculata]|uniref:ATP synthase subunit g, mitochondrial-like n=1 Tax=Pomacea canaliculata TaxID=400727 RepID=UPI000D72B633|nr:ATP synthase subunit g, mitochondrial-like [Pomacea canaliculata]